MVLVGAFPVDTPPCETRLPLGCHCNSGFNRQYRRGIHAHAPPCKAHTLFICNVMRSIAGRCVGVWVCKVVPPPCKRTSPPFCKTNALYHWYPTEEV